MSCFPCFSSQKSKRTDNKEMMTSREILNPVSTPPSQSPPPEKFQPPTVETKAKKEGENNKGENGSIAAQTFTFRELATATKNFRPECLLGEGGFGRVYKAKLEKTNQGVAVKQLDRNGLQGNKEFLVEVLMLSLLHHQNLVNLIGYCADGDQRLLVYEYMPGGSLEDHLLDIEKDQKPLNWFTRMNIALGAAKGLEYLHDKANPPVIYRDFKSSNILLDDELNPKLSDFGLAKLGPAGDKMHVSSRVMGTYGYCAPEYARTGELTLKSDVYSFGVVLLELITGRRAIDTTRANDEQNLVSWAQPIFKDPKRFPEMADPLLKRHFPERGLNQAVAIAAMCLQEEASARPLMSDVVTAIGFLSVISEEEKNLSEAESDEHQLISHHDSESSDHRDRDSSASDNETDEESEDDRHQAVTKGNEYARSSTRESKSLSHKSSSSSSSSGSSRGRSVSQDDSDPSSHNSRDSRYGNMSSNGSVSFSHKSNKRTHSHKSSSWKSHDKRSLSSSENSSMESEDESVSSERKSISSIRQLSKKLSYKGRRGSQRERVSSSLSHKSSSKSKSSRASDNESVTSK